MDRNNTRGILEDVDPGSLSTVIAVPRAVGSVAPDVHALFRA